MKTKSLFILLNICLSLSVNHALAQENLFTRVFYGEDLHLQANAITSTRDSSFIVAGIESGRGMYLKMDRLGNILWSKGLNNFPVMSEFRDVVRTHDSCFILAGTLDLNNENAPAFLLLKINDAGDTLWSKTTTFTEGATLNAISETSDHGFLAIGSSSQYTVNPNNSIAVKYDSIGTIEWSNNYSIEDKNLKFSSVKQLSDDSFIITGDYYNTITNRYSLTFIKLSENGAFEWAKNPLTAAFYSSYGLDVEVVDDGFLFFYHYIDITYNYGTSLLKTDFLGNFVWGKYYDIYHTSNYQNDQSRIYPAREGGFILVNQNWDGVMMKTDSLGSPEWISNLFLNPIDVAETTGGGYIVVGNGPLFGVKLLDTYNPQIGIISTDSLGNGADCAYLTMTNVEEYTFEFEEIILSAIQNGAPASYIPEITNFSIETESGCVAVIGNAEEADYSENNLRMFPNPSSGIFSLAVRETGNFLFEELTVHNATGEVVYQTNDPSCLLNGINPGYLPEGLYLVRLIAGNSAYSGKLLIKH